MARILIIDDEEAFRGAMAQVLLRRAHEVYEAGNTADGLALAVAHQPQLIISDVCMEGGDGLSLLKTIRADPRTSTIPFVVMTGQPDHEGLLIGAENAADGYLPKPFRLETLVATVEHRLEREKALRENAEEVESQLRRILEASPDLIGIMQPPSFRFTFLNAAGRTLLGMPEGSKASELSIDTMHPPEGVELVKRVAIPTALEHGIWAGENVIAAGSGRNVPVKQFFQAHHNPRGGIAFLSTIAHDLSESKKAEAALRESEARFRWLVNSLPDAVLMHDDAGRILFSNARTEQLFGYAAAELEQQQVATLLAEPPELGPVGGKASPRHFETTCWRKTGEQFPADLVVNEVEIEGRRAKLNIIRDLTERKKLERERQDMEIQLRQALKLESIGQLAAGIAHEINTPTQYIGDNARFLRDAFADLAKLLPRYEALLQATREGSPAADLVQQVEAAAQEADITYLLKEIPLAIQQSLDGVDRVSRIVLAMKDFSHPSGSEKVLTDINHSIESTITVARNEWKYVADVVPRLDATLPLVPCLPGELNQVILNLIINAAHAIGDVVRETAGAKGVITVSTARVGDSVEIAVTDTGAGIPLQIRERIFEPFFTTKEVGKGTGQGLAICRSVIVDKHGGAIGFESEEGQGTTFTIRLPLNA